MDGDGVLGEKSDKHGALLEALWAYCSWKEGGGGGASPSPLGTLRNPVC